MDTVAITPPLQQWSLHCPQIPFKNRYGFYSAFREMNPALHYDTANEEWIVLVRGVNYEKLSNGTYALFASPAHSVYWIGHGKTLESLDFKELQWEYKLPTYGSYWNGIEDARFLDRRRILVTVPQLDSRGQPTMFCCTLDESLSRLENFQRCEPSEKAEKNWMPMPGGTHVLYSVCPLQFKPYDTGEGMFIVPLTSQQKELLEGFHGSTNGILWKTGDGQEGQLYLIHKTIEVERGAHTASGDSPKRVVHRWLYLGTDGKVQVSQLFVFFTHSYIEFPCSLVRLSATADKKGYDVYVSLGVNDMHALILRVQPPFFS
jgi:hypothetical protein